MDYYELIAGSFKETLEHVALSVDALAQPIEQAGILMTEALLSDARILACGNGPDGALAQLFASNLLGCFEQERPALPVMVLGAESTSLTAISGGGAVEDTLARPLRALAQPGDVLLAICSDKPADNLVRALATAREMNVRVVLLSNPQAHELAELLTAQDVDIGVSSENRHRCVEVFTMAIHCFCALIDHGLFGAHELD